MPGAKLVRYIKFSLLGLITLLWAGTLPFVLLAVGFSGGEMLSLTRLYRDFVAGNDYWQDVALTWLYVIWPIVLVLSVIRLRQRI